MSDSPLTTSRERRPRQIVLNLLQQLERVGDPAHRQEARELREMISGDQLPEAVSFAREDAPPSQPKA